jgi:hypothetical protein
VRPERALAAARLRLEKPRALGSSGPTLRQSKEIPSATLASTSVATSRQGIQCRMVTLAPKRALIEGVYQKRVQRAYQVELPSVRRARRGGKRLAGSY